MRDPYLYKDCDVLINKAGIKNAEDLERFESDTFAIKHLSLSRLKGNFDYEHFKAIHKHLFGDVYDWAGTERTIPIYKHERVLFGNSVEYSQPKKIIKDAKAAILSLKNEDWKNKALDEKVAKLVEHTANLWRSHPFREGNTRVTITFICEFADSQGFALDRSLLSQYSEYVRDALVMASIDEKPEPQHLQKIFKDAIQRGHVLNKEPIKNVFTNAKKRSIQKNSLKSTQQNKRINIDNEHE